MCCASSSSSPSPISGLSVSSHLALFSTLLCAVLVFLLSDHGQLWLLFIQIVYFIAFRSLPLSLSPAHRWREGKRRVNIFNEIIVGPGTRPTSVLMCIWKRSPPRTCYNNNTKKRVVWFDASFATRYLTMHKKPLKW